MSYTVRISKDRFKFSATHFTIFSEEEAEHLHGHNYQVSLSLQFKKLTEDTGLSVEFSKVKSLLGEVCETLDEKVLLPADSPFVGIGETDTNFEVKYGDRFYSLPKEGCKALNIVNTSSECLAQWVYNELKPSLDNLGVKSFAVTLEETRGQSVTYENESVFSKTLK